MQRLAHARRLRARNELAEQDDALRAGRPLRRLLAERRVERIDERFGGRGRRGLLPCVHRRPPRSDPFPRATRRGSWRSSSTSMRFETMYPGTSGPLANLITGAAGSTARSGRVRRSSGAPCPGVALPAWPVPHRCW